MKTYFYTDANGQKQGPVSKRKLQILATLGTIEPNTPVETFEGRECLAGQIPSLWDRSLSNEPSVSPGFFFGWVLTVILALVCVVVPPFIAVFFLLIMWKLFTIESHLRSIRELYEDRS